MASTFLEVNEKFERKFGLLSRNVNKHRNSSTELYEKGLTLKIFKRFDADHSGSMTPLNLRQWLKIFAYLWMKMR